MKKLGYNKKILVSMAICSYMALLSSGTYAAVLPQAPSGVHINNGQITVNINGNTMTITQAEALKRGIINWGSFNVGADGLVNFNQLAGSSAITLNRVAVSGGFSNIAGKINANGNIILVNPNGILFANGSEVNVAGIIASTVDIKDENFLVGKMIFERSKHDNIGKDIPEGAPANMKIGDIIIEGTIVAQVNNEKALNALGIEAKPVTELQLDLNNKIILAADRNIVVGKDAKLVAITSTTRSKGESNTVGEEEFDVEDTSESSTAVGRIVMRSDASAWDNDKEGNKIVVELNNTNANQIQSMSVDVYYNPDNVKNNSIDNTNYNKKDYTAATNAPIITAYQDKISSKVTKMVTDTKTGENAAAADSNGVTLPDVDVKKGVYMLVNDVYQLQDISALDKGNLNGSYAQGISIEAAATKNWNSSAGFDPIGTVSNPFTGAFTGDGGIQTYTINNLNIKRSTTDNVGLFGYAQNASFTNVHLRDSRIQGQDNVGGIVGYMSDSSITWSSMYESNLVIDVSNITANTYTAMDSNVEGRKNVGGIVGYSAKSSVHGATSNGIVRASDKNLGGIAGNVIDTKMSYSKNSGVIINTHSGQTAANTGGMVGSLSGTSVVSIGQNSGQVFSNSDNTAGIAGYMTDTAEIKDLTYNNGQIFGRNNTGGLVGQMLSGKIDSSYNTNEADTLNTYITDMNAAKSQYGKVVGSGDNTGGLVGNMSGGSISNAYNAGNVKGANNVGGLVGNMSGGNIQQAYNADNNTVYYAPGTLDASHEKGAAGYYDFTYGGEKYVQVRNAKTGEVYYYKASDSSKTPISIKDLPKANDRVQNIRIAFRDANIEGINNVGGLVGTMSAGSISETYNAGKVIGNINVGSIAGANSGGVFSKTVNVYADTQSGDNGNVMSGTEKMVGNMDNTVISGVQNQSLQWTRDADNIKSLFSNVNVDAKSDWMVHDMAALPMLYKKYMSWAKIERVFEYDGTVHNLKTDDIKNLYGSAEFDYMSGMGKNVYTDTVTKVKDSGLDITDPRNEYAESSLYMYNDSNLWSPQHGYYIKPDSTLIITPVDMTIKAEGNKTYGENKLTGFYTGTSGNGYKVTGNGFIVGEDLSYLDFGEYKGYEYSGDKQELGAGSYTDAAGKSAAGGVFSKSVSSKDGKAYDNLNYNIKYETRLTVKKADLVININGERDYGSANSSGKYTYTAAGQASNAADSALNDGNLKSWDKLDDFTNKTLANTNIDKLVSKDNVTHNGVDTKSKEIGTSADVLNSAENPGSYDLGEGTTLKGNPNTANYNIIFNTDTTNGKQVSNNSTMKITPAELNYNVSGERQYGLGNDQSKYSVNVNTAGLKNDDVVKDILTWNGSDADVNNVPTDGVNNSTLVTDNADKYSDKLSLNSDVLQVKSNNHNYVLKATKSEFTITKAKIIINTATDSKTYDGNKNSSGVVSYDPNQLYNGDTISGLSQSFESKDAGTGINMKLNDGYKVNDNNSGGNYDVTILEATGTINKAKLNIEADRQYDGTALANGSLFGSINTGIGSETITVGGSGVLDGKDVGVYDKQNTNGLTLVNGTNGGLGANYELDNVKVAITPKELTISGERQYNGTMDAAGGIFTDSGISGLIGNENIAIGGSGSFADKDVARDASGNIIYKTVNNNGLTLADGSNGGKADNYIIKEAKAKITPKELNISGERVYDGTVDANNVIFNNIGGLVGTETIVLGGSGSFADKNVARDANGNVIDKSVAYNDFTLADGDNGGKAGNYVITEAKAKITPKNVSISGERVYDGTANADYSIFDKIDGLLNGEILTVGKGVGQLADGNVARDAGGNIISKDLNTNGSLVLADGTGLAGNYFIEKGTVKITPKDLTIKVDTPNEREYGNANPNFDVSGSGFAAGEGFGNLSGSANYKVDGKEANDPNVNRYLGVGQYDVTVEGYSSGNYTINYASTQLKVNQAKYYYVADPKTYFFGFPIDGSQGGMIVDSIGRVVALDLISEERGGHGNFYTLAKQNDAVGSYAIWGEGTTTVGGMSVWSTNNYSIEQKASNAKALRILPNDQYQTEIANNTHAGSGGMIQRIGVGSIRYLSVVESGVSITNVENTSNIEVDANGKFIVKNKEAKK